MPRLDPARHRRRVIRLGILAGIVLFIVGGFYALFQFQSGKQQLDTDQILQQARDAHKTEDYARVLDLLEQTNSQSNTIPAIREDAELIKLYIDARRETPLLNGEHLLRLVPPLQTVVRLTPEDVEARNDLLDLLLLLQRHSESKRLAEHLLIAYPDDVELWRALGAAHAGLGAQSNAIDAYRQAGKLQPLDVYTQVEIIRLLQTGGLPITPFTDNAKRVYKQHPDDPRGELILALAHLAERNIAQARGLLQTAADREPPNEHFVPALVHWLDKAELFDTSLAYLDRAAASGADTYASREIVYRTYDAGDMRGVLNLLKDADPTTAYPDLVAVWALASAAQGEQAQAEKLIAGLGERPESIAAAWAELLPLLLSPDTPAGQMIDTATRVMAPDPDNPASIEVSAHPYMLQALGEAYLQVNEPHAALQAFQTAAANRPSWAKPHRLLARTLLGLGRADDAVLHAKAAWQRQPNASSASLRVLTQLAAADTDDRPAADKAIKLAEQLLAQIPDHPDVLPELVGLLARTGKQDLARQHVMDALRLDPPPSAGLLMSLHDQSERYRLGLSRDIQTKSVALHGQTPEMVLDQAFAMAQKGQTEQGRALIEQAMPDAPGPGWRVALGRYLVWVNDPKGTAYWIALADELPGNLGVQLEALQSTAARGDTAFAERAIERLKKFGGDASAHWRLEQARLLMRDGAKSEQLDQALALLIQSERLAPTRVEAHLELARCQEMLGNLSAAEQSSRKAKHLAPNHPGVTLGLASVLHQLGRIDESRVELLAVASNPRATPSERTTACDLLYEQGERRALRGPLESMRDNATAGLDALLLLARVYIALEQYALADTLCDQLLKSADLDTTLFIATYFEQTGRPERAEQARKTAAKTLSPADRLTLEAQRALQVGQPDQAMRLIVEAAEAEPSDPDRWRNATRVALMLSRSDQAIALAERGLQAAGEDAGLRALVDHRALIKPLQTDRSLIPFGTAIVSSDRLRDASVRILRAVSTDAGLSTGAEELAELAAAEPDFQALHELAGERLFAAKQYRAAYQLASNAMNRFPGSAVSARTTALAAYRLKDWVTLLKATETWRLRDSSDRHLIDLLTAAAQDALQRYDAVITTLGPHIGKLDYGTETNYQYYILYTRALVRAGQAEQAWSVLDPLIQKSDMALQIVFDLIANDLGQTDTAARWLDAASVATQGDPGKQFAQARAAYTAGARLSDDALIASAHAIMDRLFALPGPHPVDAHALRGEIARVQGDLDLAEKSFRRVYESAPENPHALNNLAMVLIKRGTHLAEAEQLAERATQIDANDPNLLDTLALVRGRLGKLDLAERAITKAIHLDPENPAWRLAHADILDALGETERAEKIRERYNPVGSN